MTRQVHVAASGLIVAAVAMACPLPANAASGDGSTTVTVTLGAPPTRSITVGPATIALDHCWASSGDWVSGQPSSGTTLSQPNGFCLAGGTGVTVTNGATAGHITVRGTNATGIDGTGTWTLTGNQAIVPGGLAPSTDQFNASTVSGNRTAWSSTNLSTTDANDCAYYPGDNTGNSCGTSGANQSVSENIAVTGPTTSTGSATSYGFTVTWTAIP